MSADASTPNIIIVGDAAAALNVTPDALESIGGDARVTRTVLRSEVLYVVRHEPLDLIVAVAAVALLATADLPDHRSPLRLEPQPSNRRDEHDVANIDKTLEEAMKIDGAIGVALADWESGLCLGTAGSGSRLNVEIAAAGNCQVVKAKMSTMSELGIKGAIQDILITLDDQIHLIRPVKRAENLFLYLAVDKTKGNLGMARHRIQKLEAELNL